MKKILCLIDGLGFGGAQRQIIGLTSMLQQRGYETCLASYHQRDFYANLVEREKIRSVTLKNDGGRWSKFNAIRRFVKKEQFDVLITYLDGPNIIGCLLKMLDRKFRLIVSDRSTKQWLGLNERIMYRLYDFADVIVPNANSQAEFIKTNFHFLKKKVTTICNFTDTNYFFPANDKLSPWNHSGINILVAGRIAKSKNTHTFLDALQILKQKRVNIHVDWFGNVGYGMKNYMNSIIQKCIDLQINEMIYFHPGTNNILYEYQKCDVFCLPSTREGFPNTICEAMSCGKPILCGRICDNPIIIEEGKNGLMFDPTNAEDIANVIEVFSRLSFEERKSMGKHSRELALQKFSEETFVNKYVELIES